MFLRWYSSACFWWFRVWIEASPVPPPARDYWSEVYAMVWKDEILLLLKPAPVPLKVDLLRIYWLFMLSIIMIGTLMGLCFC